jgi:hypothetical protein
LGHGLLDVLLHVVAEAILLLVVIVFAVVILVGVVLIGVVVLLPLGAVGDEVGGVTTLEAA